MKQFVEVPLEDGGSILVAVEEAKELVMRAGRGPGDIVKASETFEDAVEAIKPVASAIVSKMHDIPYSPEEIKVDFGLGLKLDSSGILKMLVSTGTDVNFKVSLTWKKPNVE